MGRSRVRRVGVTEYGSGGAAPLPHTPKHPYLRLVGWLILAISFVAAAWLLTRAFLGGRDATWARIQETGVWRVGMDPSFPPFENLDGTTQRPVGLDVDLAGAIAARWGVRVEIVGLGFDELVDAVAAHRVDSALSALPVIEYRTKEVSFSTPYVEAGVLLAVPTGSSITGKADLAGRRLAAEWGSTGDAQARVLQQEFDGNLELVLRESPDAAMEAVLNGQADAVAVDAVSLALSDQGKSTLAPVGGPLLSDPYVIVSPANAPKLLAAINDALAALEADGTLPKIRARWLGR
jgi:ABC-type amino acid transport substrate-binding protein